MVKPNEKKLREYETVDYIETAANQMPENFDDTVPYIDINKRTQRMTTPGLDTDKVSYSPSKTARRGSGGRATMLTYAAQYMKSMDRKYMEGTKDALWRRYKRISKDIDYLFKLGVVSTISPVKFTSEDVYNYLKYRDSLKLSGSETVHDMSALSNIFTYIGNDAYKTAIAKYPELKATAIHTRLCSLTHEEFKAILDAADKVSEDNWKEMVRYATVIFAIASGLRSKELRFCNVNDVHMNSEGLWTVDVFHPKGEGKYGEERQAPIISDAYPFLRRYFVARAKHIRAIKATTHALFLGSVATDGYLASNTTRMYAEYVSKQLGIDVDLRKCRRTYGQLLIDADVPISLVSVVMGHCSTRTTEQHYARVKQTVAIKQIAKTLEDHKDEVYESFDSQMPTGFDSRQVSPQEGE